MNRPPAFIFDLDDTLYAERDYVSSCFSWVADRLGQPEIRESLTAAFKSGEPDPIGALCAKIGVGDEARISLISDMRAHQPSISLLPDAERFIARLRAEKFPYSIVTNGRSVTQRRKIDALGVGDAISIAISEEIGAEKPDPQIFSLAAEAHEGAACVYVGDNPGKDFLTPNKMNWLSVMRAHDGSGVHRQDIEVPVQWRAQRIVSALDELVDLI